MSLNEGQIPRRDCCGAFGLVQCSSSPCLALACSFDTLEESQCLRGAAGVKEREIELLQIDMLAIVWISHPVGWDKTLTSWNN